MTKKTIENRFCTKGIHITLEHSGFQEGVGVIGTCLDCYSTRKITDDYEFRSGGIYVLKDKEAKRK